MKIEKVAQLAVAVAGTIASVAEVVSTFKDSKK